MLLNADGYTTLWNRWMQKEVFFPAIFGYIKGKLATKDEYYIQGNLHGFKTYYTSPNRNMFQANMGATRTYDIQFPATGPVSFAYAVDASWEPPKHIPPSVPNDFPLTANSIEPYKITVSVVADSLTKTGGAATVDFDVYDWQDATLFSSVHVEAPDLFPGPKDPGAPIAYPTANSARYEVVLPNLNGDAVTAEGGSDLLIAVEDVENSTTGPDLTAYNIVKVPVADVAGYWRDRHGDGTFVNVPLGAPYISPSSGPTGVPDLTVVSDPVSPYAVFGGDPEILLFDDTNSRFIIWNRTLNGSIVRAGYPYSTPPSWLLDPMAIDATNSGIFGVISSNTLVIPPGPYEVENAVNMFGKDGVYIGNSSWWTNTDDGTPNAYLEKARDVTGGFGNVVGDPVYGLYAYESGATPTSASVLSIGNPYTTPGNTFRTWIPMSNAGYMPGAINSCRHRY